MTPMCVLPPVPAVWGDGLARGVARGGSRRNEPWVLTWLRQNRDGPYWRHGSVRATARPRLRPDRLPVDDRRRLGRRLPQQLLPHGRGAARRGSPAPAARRPVGARRPDARPTPARASTSSRRWSRGGTAGCAGATRRRTTTGSTSSCGPRRDPQAGPRPARGPLDQPTLAVARGRVADPSPRPARGPLDVAARRRHRGVDRLRRPPAVGAVDRPARRTTPAP